jgi:gliding motility-associated-like protein
MFAEIVTWTTSGTGKFDNPSLVNASYTPSSTDILNGSVVLTITCNQTGQCSSVSDNIVLNISNRPSGNAGGNLATCSGQPITLSETMASNYTSVHWSTNGIGMMENENTLHPTYIPGEGESGTVLFYVQIIGESACASDTIFDEVELTIYKQLLVDAGIDQTIFYSNSTLLSVTVENGSGSYFYNWEPAVLVVDDNAKSTDTYNLTRTTDFEVTVTDANSNCWASDIVTVYVEEDQDLLLKIFNAFSPNNDGVNDVWVIEGIENFPENKVEFFNRWGDKLREFDNYDNINSVWDGTNIRGNLVADGTYYYILTITGVKTYTGWVNIRSER